MNGQQVEPELLALGSEDSPDVSGRGGWLVTLVAGGVPVTASMTHHSIDF
jgi:hypothetical protein